MRILEWFRFVKSLDELRVNLDRQRRDIERYRELNDQLSEEVGEIEHIAAEMAEALERIRTNERNNYLSCDEMLCAECLDDDQCPGKIADMALQKWEQWREEQS
jgi:hypothetical protein